MTPDKRSTGTPDAPGSARSGTWPCTPNPRTVSPFTVLSAEGSYCSALLEFFSDDTHHDHVHIGFSS